MPDGESVCRFGIRQGPVIFGWQRRLHDFGLGPANRFRLICVLINYCLKCPLRLCFATQPLVKNADAKLRAGCQCPLLVGLTDDLAVEFDRFGEILIAFVEHAGSLEDLARILLPES